MRKLGQSRIELALADAPKRLMLSGNVSKKSQPGRLPISHFLAGGSHFLELQEKPGLSPKRLKAKATPLNEQVS